ncbi:GNAT family N-acetyltransferase [Candidatus Microgenomates bacterium]|nr:GNAT family N-acetyltransferase [Candidatus Microgenomates bacterium]
MTQTLPVHIIRRYTDDDYEAVESILRSNHQFDEIWDHRENLASMVTNDPDSVLVAETDGHVVGNVIITGYGAHIAYLFRLSVREGHKNRGVGTRLLDTACEILKKRGTREVSLIVDASREELKEYYKRRGYSTSGRTFIYMTKGL